MKALHILKIVLKDTVMSREKEYIQEAIAELGSLIEEQKRDQVNASMSQKESVDLLNRLEQLQNRSCESCKECMYLGVDTDICLKCSHSYSSKFKRLNNELQNK